MADHRATQAGLLSAWVGRKVSAPRFASPAVATATRRRGNAAAAVLRAPVCRPNVLKPMQRCGRLCVTSAMSGNNSGILAGHWVCGCKHPRGMP